MLDNTAHLVIGPESSGNRYLTGLLVSGGCDGVSGTTQPFDRDGWHIQVDCPRPHKIAMCRSYPHGGDWPHLPTMVAELKEQGYRTVVLFLTRCTPYCARSQVRAGFAPHVLDAYRRIQGALAVILSDLAMCSPATVLPVAYDWLGQDDYRQWLCARLGLSGFKTPWVDGDQKYRDDDSSS